MRGVLLDVDGTLLNSNDAHAHAWVEAIQGDRGASLPFDHVRRRIGEGGDKLLWELLGLEEHSPAGEHLSELKHKIFHARYLPTLAPTPGARALLLRLQREGVKRVVATSAAGTELRLLLEAALVGDLIEDEATKDDAGGHSKPDPDVVEAAIARSGLPRDELMMLGDTPYDIQAATKSGIPTIALRSGGWSSAELAGATAIYDDPSDLLHHYDDSPLAWRAAARDSIPCGARDANPTTLHRA